MGGHATSSMMIFDGSLHTERIAIAVDLSHSS